MKHMLSLMDWTTEELRSLLALSAEIKADPLGRFDALTGKTLAMIFEKPSTRTRVSFEVAMNRLGGQAMFLSPNDMQLGRGETIEDTAQVLSRFVDAIMARVFSHSTIEKLATGSVPVINGLSDLLHPCQALADALTLRERFGDERGVEMAYLGDGNNVCHSLINAAARLGIRLRVGTPAGYEPDPTIVAAAREAGADITLTTDPKEAVAGAQALYTDVWTSMGDEAEAAERTRALDPFRVDASLMALAAPEAIFLHCLPAHRGEEVTAEVLDGPQSVVFDQAENRMHTEQALLLTLMAGG
ncbi:Ornithine carbamoyltransferase [hydrothermal vent metagenome]|uniref:ornithine carbamoyltransferase n=1 Tax=hydrothermal vent metagenome TaxID=652676 RepID=A0A3B1DAY0_9ZZZZ